MDKKNNKEYCKKCGKELPKNANNGGFCSDKCRKKNQTSKWLDGILEFFSNI